MYSLAIFLDRYLNMKIGMFSNKSRTRQRTGGLMSSELSTCSPVLQSTMDNYLKKLKRITYNGKERRDISLIKVQLHSKFKKMSCVIAKLYEDFLILVLVSRSLIRNEKLCREKK